MKHTFQHTFGLGFTCTVQFDPSKHFDLVNKRIKPLKYWHPEPTPDEYEAIYSEYVEWMHTVNLQMAQIVKSDHLLVIQDRYAKEPFWEMWLYQANGEKKQLRKEKGLFSA